MAAKDRTTFICGECGYESAKWMGKCPQCDSWNTLTESAQVKVKTNAPAGTAVSQKLSKVVPLPQKRVSAGMGEFDRVLGGGLIGAGWSDALKSRLLLYALLASGSGTSKVRAEFERRSR